MSKLALSEHDHELYKRLRRSSDGGRILEDIEPHRLPVNQGVILVTCSDGDHFSDIFTHLGQVITGCGHAPRIHTIALNGGPLSIHPKSPLNLNGESEVLTRHITAASAMKGINTVALLPHVPCGAAAGARLPLEHVIDLLLHAKLWLEEQAPHLDVRHFLQVDVPHHRELTYFVSSHRWNMHCVATRFVSSITNAAPLYAQA